MDDGIKLVVCDIDDTLVHKEQHLSAEVINKIKELRKHGVYFTFATGRMPHRVELLAQEAGLDIPYIANNGSILYDRGNVIDSKLLDAWVLKDTLQSFMAESVDFTVIFSYIDRERPVERTPWIEARLHKYIGYDQTLGNTDNVWKQSVHKVYVVDDERTGLIGRVAKALQESEGEFSFFQYGEYSIEIVAFGCTKASGVQQLIKHMNIKMEQVMVIGDHTNDIEAVRTAGLGIAVANADPKLKEIADYITGGERDAGVIEAIDRFVLRVKEKQA